MWKHLKCVVVLFLVTVSTPPRAETTLLRRDMEKEVSKYLSQMTLREKIGQMYQGEAGYGKITPPLRERIEQGKIGSVINEVDVHVANELQKLALSSPHKIPLLIGRDVIHGFRTIFPIPLGLGATFDPELVKRSAQIAGREARASGVNWTFAPMLDVTRDPRWGRVAETFGEDPFLTSKMARAMVNGFQREGDLRHREAVAACAKHYVAYGAVEAGKDYNTVVVSEQELRDVHLPPFKAAVEEGVAAVMTAFNEINGIPATANIYTIRDILKTEWGFQGVVVSDWASTANLLGHGYAEDGRDVALKSIQAGVDMEMVSTHYIESLEWLVQQKRLPESTIDAAVRRILRIKTLLGLFENPYVQPVTQPYLRQDALRTAHELARESLVLLKNENNILPVRRHKIGKIAVLGPLADAPLDQLGTWVFDGKKEETRTPLVSIRSLLGSDRVLYDPVLTHSRDQSKSRFEQALGLASGADITLLFVGEESILSGEAHSRVHLNLPGAQSSLVEYLSQRLQKPLILIVMAGRPLVLGKEIEWARAVLYAWHPGTMGGPALSDVLFGLQSPSGRLPVSFPRAEGQIPIYYAHKNTGRPPKEPIPTMESIPIGAPQTSLGNLAFYLDESTDPLFPFGFGLTYGKFVYDSLRLIRDRIQSNQSVDLSFRLSNIGTTKATEVVQVYVRDKVASLTRPVKELRHFQRVTLRPGEEKRVAISLPFSALGFHNPQKEFVVEQGEFEIWVGPHAAAGLSRSFKVDQ